MNIPKHITDDWKQYIDRGDIKAISKLLRVSTRTVSSAINEGKGTAKTIRCIKRFVDKKKELLKY